MRTFVWAWVAAACVGCGADDAPARTAREEAAVAVAAQPANTGSVRAVVRAGGTVVPADGAEFLVVAPETARVVEIAKAEGDVVQSGDVLARFELPSATTEAARQQAELARLQAQLENVRIARTRVADFVTRGLVARKDLEEADRELAEAQAAVDRAMRASAAAEAAAGRAMVRAPFSGVVAKRLHNPGDLVQGSATDPVLRIVDPRRVEVHATVADADVPRVLPGASARMASPVDSRPIPLTVASRGTGGTVRLTLMSAETVPVDTPVQVEIDAEERPGVVFLPPEALIHDAGQTLVMIAAGERAERRPVTTGIMTDERVEITSGLRAGELVITRGHIGLPDGARVSVAR